MNPITVACQELTTNRPNRTKKHDKKQGRGKSFLFRTGVGQTDLFQMQNWYMDIDRKR